MAFILVTFFAVGLAFGQAGRVTQVEIPYEFTFASKVLPAGTYTFSVTEPMLRSGIGHRQGVSRRSSSLGSAGRPNFFGTALLYSTKRVAATSSPKYGCPGRMEYLLHSIPKSHSRDVYITSGLNQTRNVSGKAAYNRTCGKCHGPDGKGDERADKFFNITIPRLSSAEVQGKSDAELREIITKGSSAMPPVEIDESGFRHRLPEQSVDAVIAYLRTLKQ